MSKNNDHHANSKNIKRDIIFSDIGLIVLGLLMFILRGKSNNVICIIGSVLIGAGGILKLYMYFSSNKHTPFSSFGLVPGVTLIIFAILLVASPHIVAETLIKVLSMILIVSAVMKIQYTVDFIRLKDKRWYIPLLGAVAAITVGCLVIFDVFEEPAVWSVLGLAHLVSSGWDIASVIMLSNSTEISSGTKRKSKNS